MYVTNTFGKISVQPHPTLCIQFLNRENNDKNNTFPLGKQICFTMVWGCAETLPRDFPTSAWFLMLLSGDISCVTRDSNCCWSFAITATILPNLWFERMRVIFPEWNILAAKELFKFWRDHLQHCQNLIVYHELRRFCVEFLVEYRGPGPLPDLDITTPTTTGDVWRSNQKLEKNIQGVLRERDMFSRWFFFF